MLFLPFAGLLGQTSIAGVYKCNDGGIYYVGQNGSQVVWFGEKSDKNGQFANVFVGTIAGDVLTGSFWDVPKFNTAPEQTAGKGNLTLRINATSLLINPRNPAFGGTVWTKVRPGESVPRLPSTRPVVANNNRNYHGIWQCDDGGVYYIREDGNNFIWFGEGLNNDGKPGFSNIFKGVKNGNRVDGFFMDVPKGGSVNSNRISLTLTGFTQIAKTGGTGFGGANWTRPALTGRMTAFNPLANDGFNFVNTGTLEIVKDIRFDGLCAGMVYSALDYFSTRVPTPAQNFFPAEGTPLLNYIRERHLNANLPNADKWLEHGFNPGGARNAEFFNWGILSTGGHRIAELKASIDRGAPVAIGLVDIGEMSLFGGSNHVALAIGYHMGRYRGDGGQFKEDLTIFLYDPNFPNRIMSMVADWNTQSYFYIEAPMVRFRAYFVDSKYSAKTPPRIADAIPPSPAGVISELLLEFRTGQDDLRGGNDNLNVTLLFNTLPPQTLTNVNRSQSWRGNYTETVRIRPTTPFPLSELRGVTLTATQGGCLGCTTDNWDLANLRVMLEGGPVLFDYGYTPARPILFRFTGQNKTLNVGIPPR